MKITVTIICLCFGTGLFGQDVVGKWHHYDEDTGKLNSIIETYIKNDSLFARLHTLYVSEHPDTLVCKGCPGVWNNKKILGLDIINGLVKKDTSWEGDSALLDAEAGEVYDCKVWYEEGNLKVRGYLGFLYQTITWYPVDKPEQKAR